MAELKNTIINGSLNVVGEAAVNGDKIVTSGELGDWAKASTKPVYTANEVGLGNVTNESKATMFTSPNFTTTATINSKEIATKEYVDSKLDGVGDTAETFYANGSDYAICLQWTDGNPNLEDRQNRFVTLANGGNTIDFARHDSDIYGVTTDTAGFVENYGVADEHSSLVGVLGVVTIIDNGTCTVGECCMSDDNGYATPSTNNMGYRVMERLDETKIRVAVKTNDDMIQRIKADMLNVESEIEALKEKSLSDEWIAYLEKATYAEPRIYLTTTASKTIYEYGETAPEINFYLSCSNEKNIDGLVTLKQLYPDEVLTTHQPTSQATLIYTRPSMIMRQNYSYGVTARKKAPGTGNVVSSDLVIGFYFPCFYGDNLENLTKTQSGTIGKITTTLNQDGYFYVLTMSSTITVMSLNGSNGKYDITVPMVKEEGTKKMIVNGQNMYCNVFRTASKLLAGTKNFEIK